MLTLGFNFFGVTDSFGSQVKTVYFCLSHNTHAHTHMHAREHIIYNFNGPYEAHFWITGLVLQEAVSVQGIPIFVKLKKSKIGKQYTKVKIAHIFILSSWWHCPGAFSQV